jgi:hypothetical protein
VVWSKSISNSELSNYLVDNVICIPLEDVIATKISLHIPNALANKSTSFDKIECYGYTESQDVQEILTGKQFIPTSEAQTAVHGANFGYNSLTDGLIGEGVNRFSTKINNGINKSMVDATVDLEANYQLDTLKIALYKQYWVANSSEPSINSAGADLKIEVFDSNGE